jgi:hypothetical protein|tara:strand:+ start:419 stop:1006 length:588 start_codon:yes stop_codon:yes gene_type:complete
MPFWSTNFGEDTTLKDPKRQFRFTVEFQGIQASQGGAMLWYAKTVSKPSFAIASSEHKYLNHTFYYPGSVTWNDVAVTLVDPVDPDMTATVSDIVVQSGYTPPTDSTSLSTMSKAKAAGALGTIIITQIDSDGNPLETWTLWNSFLTEVKYGDLAYGTDDLTEMSLTVKYDWARVETSGPSVAVAGAGGTEFFNS